MSEHPLKRENFESYDWQRLIDDAESPECQVYSRLLHVRGEELGKAGDYVGQAISQFLSACTSGWLDSSSKDMPYHPMFVHGTSRTPIPDDIPDSELALLSELARKSRDPELRARLADIAWLRLRDHRMALLAIDSYLESAAQLDTLGSWTDAKDRVERALRVATQLGRAGQAKFDAVVEFIENQLGTADAGEERRFQPLQLMELLIEFRAGDMNRWSTLSETLAERAESSSAWEQSEAYWETKAAWDRRRNDDNERQAAQVRAAETRINLARELLQKNPPDHLLASIHLQKAVEGMRQAGESGRAEALHHELLRSQELALGQMQRIGQEVDISSHVTAAIEAVRGQPLELGLVILATMQQPPSVTALRQYAERSGKEFVFSSLFPSIHLDNQGRVVAVRPSRLSSDPEEVERAIQADMFEHARHIHEAYSVMFIEPAREQIVLDHQVMVRDLQSIVLNNPLIAPGRADLVLRGLYAGLNGDFVVASHLLVPQIEHSIRHVLNQKGVITTSLSSERIQEEQDLSRLLQRQETIETWGEDLTFDLRGLLVERFGANLRNRLAHGLVDERELSAWPGRYLWWIALRFYLLPILMRIRDVPSTAGEPENGVQASSN